MPTEAEIKVPYIVIHSELEQAYYQDHQLTKEEFDQLHGDNWDAMRQTLIDAGYITSRPPPLAFEASNPAHDPPTRIEHVEEFLRRAFP